MRICLFYLPFCLIWILFLGCESRKAVDSNQEWETILLPQSEYVEILRIALDSVVGAPDNWKEWEKFSKADSLEVAVEVIKEPFILADYPREILSGWGFTSTPAFQEGEFKRIIENPIFGVPDVANNNLKILSGFRYKPIYTETYIENYFLQDETPVCKVKFYPIALNEHENKAIIVCRLLVAPEWGEGVAFFFNKVDKEWILVARKQLWIN
ncbi:hypothetical protein BH24BAC1_BH24BAC1_15580 [soil metagenome]